MRVPRFLRFQRKSEAAKRVDRSFSELGISTENTGQVENFLNNHERALNINKKKAPLWVHFIFLPVIFTATGAALNVLVIDKQSSETLKDKALTGLLAALTAGVGFYAGKVG